MLFIIGVALGFIIGMGYVLRYTADHEEPNWLIEKVIEFLC